jgi:hypothetical protein
VDVLSNSRKLVTPLKIVCKDWSSAKPQVVPARAARRRRRCSSGDVLATVRYHHPYHALF